MESLLSNYMTLKGASDITFAAVDAYNMVVTKNMYNPDTGVLLGSGKIHLSLTDLQNKVIHFQSQIDNLNALITDLQALPVPK